MMSRRTQGNADIALFSRISIKPSSSRELHASSTSYPNGTDSSSHESTIDGAQGFDRVISTH